MYRLHIANKNYSSWSLRPWVLMTALEIPFEEWMLRFGDTRAWADYRQRVSRAGQVPCLEDGNIVVWDSLSIAEYLAERHRGVWPEQAAARAWARSAAAEMHSGFSELRSCCSMTCGLRIRLREFPNALERDLTQLGALWNDGLRRFGGPFLAGPEFTAADAFFAPVAFRVQTYMLPLDPASMAYVTQLLELPAMRAWYDDALRETFRDDPHEQETRRIGTVLTDFRAR
ncbi:MAG: glutathione S-transferase family protein [Steroidobacteraceae bacterium]